LKIIIIAGLFDMISLPNNIKALSVLCALASIVNAFDVEPYPTFRFRPYAELTAAQKAAAIKLKYTEATWNQPGAAGIEYLSWYNYVDPANDYYDWDGDGNYYEPPNDPGFLAAAQTLGFVGDTAEDVWDCWQTHYYYYDWADMVKYDLASSWEALGWYEARWDGTDTTKPDSDSKGYNALSNAEKTAASTLCYTQKIWDYKVLPFCSDKTGTVNGQTCNYFSLDISRCFADPSGANWKHCPNTCGGCDWDLSPVPAPVAAPVAAPVSAPVSSPVSNQATCKDDCNFTFRLNNFEKDVGCRWIKKNIKQVDKRKNAYCINPSIAAACPATCNEQCANTPGFSYIKEWNGETAGCNWLLKNNSKRSARMAKYCPTIGDKCVSSCGSC